MAKGDLRRKAAQAAGLPPVLNYSVVAGAAANANIAITGIKRKDLLQAVLEFQPPTAAAGNAILGDRVSEASVTSDGNIQLSSTNSTGNQLLVIWASIR